jgi:membrane protease YdiL (CAAX protease family)
MESHDRRDDETDPAVSPASRDAGPLAAPVAQAALPRGPLFGPYLRVFLYILGYFLVGIVLASMGAVVAGVLVGVGAFELPPIEQELMAVDAMDIEGILKVMEPYLLPIVIATGIYSILYTWAFARIVDRKRLRDFGLELKRGWLLNFGKGALLAILILGVIFAFSLVVGSIRVEGFSRAAPADTNVFAYLVGALLAFLSVGVYEELMFRGYVLQALSERTRRVTAILVSSVIFALLHGFNPGADVFGVVNTIIIGALLCVLYFRTGSLWMPIGFHAAWNFSLGYLYSLPVSGIPLYGILNVVEVDEGSRLTGGSYGPEAGLACTIALAAWGAWLVWKRTGRGPTEG